MRKFYIISGELKVVLAAPHICCAREAACEAVLMNRDKSLAPLMIINERGFELFSHDEKEDVVLSTVEILQEAGLLADEE